MSEKREQSAPEFEFKTPLELIGFLRCTINCGERLTDADNVSIDKFIRSLKPVADPAPAAPSNAQIDSAITPECAVGCGPRFHAYGCPKDGDPFIPAAEAQRSIEQSEKGERCPKCGSTKKSERLRLSYYETDPEVYCADPWHAASVPATAERCPKLIGFWGAVKQCELPLGHEGNHALTPKRAAPVSATALPSEERRKGERRISGPQVLTGPGATRNPQFRRSGDDRRTAAGPGQGVQEEAGGPNSRDEYEKTLRWAKDHQSNALVTAMIEDGYDPQINWRILRDEACPHDVMLQDYCPKCESGAAGGREESPWRKIAEKIWCQCAPNVHDNRVIEQALDLFFTAHCECSHKGISTTRENLAEMMAALLEQKGTK
jgi:hypothetical protein